MSKIDWMKQFSPMIFVFVEATVTFHYSDSLIVFKGSDIGVKLATNMKKPIANKWKTKDRMEGGTFFSGHGG